MEPIIINNKTISQESRPFIIAEIGVNYYDIAGKEKIAPLEAAKLMIKEAAMAGADAVKFQSYKAGKIASKFSPAYWDTTKETTKSQYELFKKFDKFGEAEFIELADYSRENGILFLSTPFDLEAADFLDSLIPLFKISSSDITNIPFIRHIARKKKPIILSTGASTMHEVKEAVKAIEDEGISKIVLLHCILNYPTKFRDANLGMMEDLKESFPDYLIGYSDHTLPDKDMLLLTTAAIMGARVIEKHFTLDKNLKGNDHYHAMDPADLRKLLENLDFVEKIRGSKKKGPLDSEEPARKYARRSLVAAKAIKKGEIIKEEDLTWKRPGTGIPPNKIDEVVGAKALEDIKEDEVLTWEKVER